MDCDNITHMTNPNELPIQQLNCPKDCPFLAPRHFLPNILPFYCNKFEEFLGATPDGNVARCPACRMIEEGIVNRGVFFINAYTSPMISISSTKTAFLELPTPVQQMFVEVVKKTGRQVALSIGEQINPSVLMDEILHEFQEAKNWLGSPELKEFKGVLGDLSGFSPDLLTREANNLLLNLFQVLDKTEQSMLKNLMSNRGMAETFLEQFKAMPKDMSLLKNFRHTLYENDELEKRRLQERAKQTQMQYIQTFQNSGRNSR